MGQVEQKAQSKRNRSNIQDGIVLALYLATAFTIAVTAPNALRLIKGIDPHFREKRKPQYRLHQAFKRLQDKGLVTFTERGFTLTEKGKTHGRELEAAASVHIEIPSRWDGRWRMVIFDVWERRRKVRDQLRRLLQKAGFYRIQDSVWVHPYDCEEYISFVKTKLRLGAGILYLVAEGIENDKELRGHFSLS